MAKEFLNDIMHPGLNWKVDEFEINTISTLPEFLEVHIRNSQSNLKLTKRVLSYPVKVIYALSMISDAACLQTLMQYLAVDHDFLFGTFNPNLDMDQIDLILSYFFAHYYRHRLPFLFYHQSNATSIIQGYIRLALKCNQLPNLRLKSIKRFQAEHKKLELFFKETSLPEFQLLDMNLLPPESNGYTFQIINTKRKLIAEAKEMKHCILNYADHILSGASVFYSVSGKERATIEFQNIETTYFFNEACGYKNVEISNELHLLLCELTNYDT